MDLSVIIVCYNVKHFLEQCLTSVFKAADKIACEIFVVDNNSADGSCSMVRSSFPDVRLIRNSVNKGFSTACNQAIKQSAGKYILLLNPDTVVEEDTFALCLSFMESHPDAGALGVKMIDGNGKLLPESKRAIPTPSTAFFKMTGFSKLFPRSKLFNRYYLGHLDNTETSETEVVSGAYMFLSRKAISVTGLLDEDFFMYGEDIDISFRLIKAGFKNYYFPDVKIIHYKGESTRKGDVNYILHFYRAMLIFIRKHFGKDRFDPFYFLIRTAIYLWGLLAVFKTIIRKYFLPVADAVLLVVIFLILIPVWGNLKFGESYSYPSLFRIIIIPGYTLITMIALYFTGGYKIPSRLRDVLKGVIIGTVVVLMIYALLPQNLRFSRAVIVFGGISAIVILPLYRIMCAAIGTGLSENPFRRTIRTIIVSDDESFKRIEMLVNKSRARALVVGRVSLSPDDLDNEVLGNLEQLTEVIRINTVDEVIFSTKELSAAQIINSMHLLSEHNIEFKLVPAGEKLLIGSSSLVSDESLYIKNRPSHKYQETAE